MGLRTYPDPPTVMEVERARLQRRRRLLLAVLLCLGLAFRTARAGKGS